VRRGLIAAAFAAVLVTAAAPASAATRQFWVAAVPVQWNVVPNGQDALGHMPVDPLATHLRTVVYRRYTRDFARPVPNPYGGIPGPLLRARTGDRILVHFRNLDFDAPHSMHFHGVHYKPSSDGAWFPPFSGRDGNVKPGQSWTYRLTAGADSRGVWPYHDHSPSMDVSIAGGMFGMLSILGRHEQAPDREHIVVFAPMGGLQTIDGHAFVGNTPVFHSTVGDLVQWDVMAMGDDHHTFHVHGHRWLEHGTPVDTKTVGPAESFRIRWRERDPGTWLYHCHVEDHMMKGMIGLYRVRPR
jgi:FtsP/CotA-like multicopper oxidase with cupredoxin domain